MSNYNFSIDSLDFNYDSSKFNLSIKIVGDQFPKPDNSTGMLNNGTINFSMASRTGETCNEATFTFQTSTILSSYGFTFLDIPDEASPINGTIGDVTQTDSDYFTIQSGSLSSCGQRAQGQLIKGDKDVAIIVKKKPGVMDNYNCIDCSINTNKTAIILTFEISDEDHLTGTVNNVPGSLFSSGLGIDTEVRMGNPEPSTISGISLND
tara:strand:- start:1724 stop:2347 length:624 start_codon:yes stop_codon:yes gene_type:complete